MSISILLAEKIAQLFLILLMGYLVVRVGLLKPEDSRVLSVIMVYLVMPCMILNAFQIDNTPEVRTGIAYSFVVAGIMHLLFLALTALLKKPLKLDVIERCAVIYSNASALVIPLLEATLGSEYVVYSCGFIIVQLVLLWTHCCTVLRGDKGIDLKKIVTNLNLIAIVAAALLFALHITLPVGLVTTISSVGNMIGPLGMLLAGMAIASSPLKKLVLYDIDPDRLELVDTLCGSLIAKLDPECVYFTTTDPEKAYTDIDFAFAQIRQGGMEMREKDEKISLEFGVVGQETCGPGGMAYGLRSIPGVFQVIDDVRKYAPEAWIINYSNPAAIVAEATRRKYNNYKILNICDMPVAIMLSFAKMLGLEKYNDVDPVYFGLNHFGWWTHLYDKSGVDRMPELKEKIMKFGLAASHDKHHSDPSWRHTWENFKEILTDFPEYLPNTYLQYYLYAKESAEDMDPNYTRANMVMDGREKDMIEQAKLIRESGGKKEANLNLFNAFGDFIVDVACSIAYNNADRYLVIVENKGCIPQMPYDAMVEVPCYLRKWGPEPVTIGNIPQFQLGMMMQQVSSEKLIVDAYFEHSYQKALEAFTMNKTVPSAKVARKILDKMIEANKGYWPELH